ncbi:MAG: cell envelope integrity protein TolA, partial [Pseudomonadota bacterium]
LAQQKKQAEDKRKAEALARQLEAQRQENLRRMQSLAGATGDTNATGKDLRSAGPSGPSGSYAGKVVAKVRPNIVYPDEVVGNPRAEVEVRTAPDGTIVGTRLLQSSGNKAWDDAVLRALQKTETLPRDIDGRVPSSLVIVFRPKD